MTTVGLGADTLGAEVVEWHDLTDPAVMLGIDVVANEACHEDLTFDEDGKAQTYRGIPLTRPLTCQACNTKIGWGLATFSCPSCGGRQGGRFEPLRGVGRMRMARRAWEEKYMAVRAELNCAPGRREDVEGMARGDTPWDWDGSSQSESDDEGGRRTIVRGTVQAPRARPRDTVVPYPDVDGTTVTVCTLEELDADPHAGQALVSSAGDAPSQGLLDMSRMRRITNAGSGQSRKPSQPQSQSQPQPPGDDLLRWSPKPQEAGFEIATDENAGALPRSKQTTEASLLAAIPDVLDVFYDTKEFVTTRTKEDVANYVPTGTRQLELGYHNSVYCGKRYGVEPLLSGLPIAASKEALMAMSPEVAFNLQDEPLPMERAHSKQHGDKKAVKWVVRLAFTAIKKANDKDIADLNRTGLPAQHSKQIQRICNQRTHVHRDQWYPVLGPDGQASKKVENAIRENMPSAAKELSEDGRSIRIMLMCDGDAASGLEWMELTSGQISLGAADGRPLVHPRLAELLSVSSCISADDWCALGIDDLQFGDHVVLDNKYYGPVHPACEPLSACTISITSRSCGHRMAIIGRNQHTNVQTHSRVADACKSGNLSPHGQGPYHILLLDTLTDYKLAGLWPLPYDVLAYLATGVGDMPYFVQKYTYARCRRLVDESPRNRLKYEQTVVARSLTTDDADDEQDDEAVQTATEHALPSVAADWTGEAAAEQATVKYAFEKFKLADEYALSVMYRLAPMIGIDVCPATSSTSAVAEVGTMSDGHAAASDAGELASIFQHLTVNRIRPCGLPVLEGRAEFHRKRAEAAARVAPLDAALEGVDDGTDDVATLKHVRQVLGAVMQAFPLHASAGQSALDLPRDVLTQASSTAQTSNIHAAAEADGTCIGEALLSTDMAVLRRAFKQLRAVGKRRAARHHSALQINRMNVSQLSKLSLNTAVAAANATLSTTDERIPTNAIELMDWALVPGRLPPIGRLPIVRAIMYGIGASGTILAAPFDDTAAPVVYGVGTVQGVQKVVRAARRLAAQTTFDPWLGNMSISERTAWAEAVQRPVSVHGIIRCTQRWLGDDATWFEKAMETGGCAPRCRRAFQLAGPAGILWRMLTVFVLNTCEPVSYVEGLFCDLVHRLIEVTTVPKPFDLLRYHSLAPWTIVTFSRSADGCLQPQTVDLREVLRRHNCTIPSDDTRHSLTPWRRAPYDSPHDAFILDNTAEKNALRRFLIASGVEPGNMPSSTSARRQMALQYRSGVLDASSDIMHQSTNLPTQSSSLTDAGSLRQHGDQWDSQIEQSHVISVATEGTANGRLHFDVSAEHLETLLRCAEQYSADQLVVSNAPPRCPQCGTISAANLRKFPRRTAVASVGRGMCVRFTAFRIIHWVDDLTVADDKLKCEPPAEAAFAHEQQHAASQIAGHAVGLTAVGHVPL